MAVNAQAVVNINVNDAAFKAFMVQFDKYSKALAISPTAWKAMTKEQRALMTMFSGTVTILQQQTGLMHKMAAYAKDVTHSFEHGAKHITHMGHKMKEVGHHVLGITEKLMRWGGIAAGLMTGSGIAGLFGLDKLGEFVRRGAVSGTRVGMSMGSLKALETQFGENYGIDVKGVATAGAQAAEDPTSDAARVYKRLGLDPTKLHGTKRFTELMKAIRAKAQETGLTPERFAELYELGSVNMGAGDVRAVTKPGAKEFDYEIKHAEKAASQLEMRQEEIKKWKEFLTSLEDAGDRLKIILAKYLTPILDSFTQNSDKWLTQLDDFLKSDDMKQFIEGLPGQAKKIWEWLKGFADDLEWIGIKMGWIKGSEEQQKKKAEQERWEGIYAGDIKPTAAEQRIMNEQAKKNREAVAEVITPSKETTDTIKDYLTGGPKSQEFAKSIGRTILEGLALGTGGHGTKPTVNLSPGTAGGVPGYQTGTDLSGVPRTGTYKLHKGEMVLDEKSSALLRQSGMGDWKKAITGIESGGNYTIVNPKSGASGKYQVMPTNIGPWTQKALGRRLTQAEFLANPMAQERVFETIFQEYVNKFGNPLDAASAWFSGQPFVGNKAGPDAMGTSVPGYIRKFIAALGGSGGGIAGGHMNVNVNDNTGGNVALNLSNLITTGPLPQFPL